MNNTYMTTAKRLPVEIIYLIVDSIDSKDTVTLFMLAQVSKQFMEVVFKVRPDFTISHTVLGKYLCPPPTFQKVTLVTIPWLIMSKMKVKVSTWKDMASYPDKHIQGKMMKKKVIDYHSIGTSSMPP